MPELEVVAVADEESVLYFFFSYAREDGKAPYLNKFFKDLVAKVENLSGKQKVSFQDLKDMGPGDVWPETLAAALQKSRVLVALYSRSYFQRPYCGKEFQVFLERRRELASASNTEKIMPLLWHSKEWLSGYKLPPQTVGHIHFEYKDFPPQYLELGLSQMAQNRNQVYKRFLDACAKRIIFLAEQEPLPPLSQALRLEEIPSAFEVPPLKPEPAGAAQGPRRIHLLFLCAPEAHADSARQPVPWSWKPFGGDSRSILDLTEEVLDRRSGVEGTVLDSIERELLQDIHGKNSLPILVIDDRVLDNPEARSALVSVIDDEKIDCGFLVVLPEETKAEQSRTEWLQFGQRNKARSLATAGSGRELQEGLARIINELRQRTVESGSVLQPVEGDGPVEKPLLRGPGRAS
jgi:hypothetical protein